MAYQTPDEFVLRLVHQDLDVVVKVVDRQAADLRNPPMGTAELLDGLRVAGLPRAVAASLSGTGIIPQAGVDLAVQI